MYFFLLQITVDSVDYLTVRGIEVKFPIINLIINIIVNIILCTSTS